MIEKPVRARYNDEDVKGILEAAIGIEGKTFTRADLVAMAGQLNISPEQLAAAESTYYGQAVTFVGDEVERATFIAERRKKAVQDVAGIIVGWLLIALAFNLQIFILPVVAIIAFFPMVFATIAVAIQGIGSTFNTVGDDFDKEFEKWLTKRAKRRALRGESQGQLTA